MSINLSKIFDQGINLTVLITLLKLLSYQSLEKKNKLQAFQNIFKSGASIEKECLNHNISPKNLEAEIPTQITVIKTNIIPTQQSKNLNSRANSQKSLTKIGLNPANHFADKSSYILLHLAKVNFEEKIVTTFIERLSHQNLLQTELISMIPISVPKHVVTIRSSFSMSAQHKYLLATAIREKISANAEVKFETGAELISCIQLCDRNYKISWNLKHYLTEIT